MNSSVIIGEKDCTIIYDDGSMEKISIEEFEKILDNNTIKVPLLMQVIKDENLYQISASKYSAKFNHITEDVKLLLKYEIEHFESIHKIKPKYFKKSQYIIKK